MVGVGSGAEQDVAEQTVQKKQIDLKSKSFEPMISAVWQAIDSQGTKNSPLPQ